MQVIRLFVEYLTDLKARANFCGSVCLLTDGLLPITIYFDAKLC